MPSMPRTSEAAKGRKREVASASRHSASSAVRPTTVVLEAGSSFDPTTFCFQLCYGKRALTLYKLGENMPVT